MIIALRKGEISKMVSIPVIPSTNQFMSSLGISLSMKGMKEVSIRAMTANDRME
jgi:hypothetical protein